MHPTGRGRSASTQEGTTGQGLREPGGRPEDRRGPLGIVALLLLPLLAVVVLAVTVVLLRRAGLELDLPENAVTLAFYACWGLWALRFGQRAGIPPAALFALPERRKDWALVLVVLPLVPFSLASVYLGILAASLVFPAAIADWLAEPDTGTAAGWAGTFFSMAGVIGLGPVVEELVFRGVLLQLWARRWGVKAAVIGTSALFGVLHADLVGSLAFGVVVAVLYLRTGSLLVPIAVHALFNSIAALGESAATGEGVGTLAEFQAGWMWPAATFACTLPFLIAFVRWGMRGERTRRTASEG